MKRSLLVVALFACGAVPAQQTFNTRLLPTPQQVVRTEGFYAASNTPVATLRVDSIAGAENQEQAYRIEITPDRIRICYTSDKKDGGLYTARENLARLTRLWGDSLPCMVITDWPAFKYRGFLDDISRGPVPNERFRNRQFHELLAGLNMNYANYYTEHTLYNPAYPDISARSGLTADWLRSQAWIRMANLQCFAHFEKTLRIPFYRDIMDTRSNVDPSKPETYAFLKSQIANLLRAYHPWIEFININCDETESLGSGRARAYVDSVGAEEAYCRHINRVYGLIQECIAEHRAEEACSAPKVLMWGDIVGKNPAMLRQLPREMQYIVWSYGAQESYADMIAPFKKIHDEQGNDFWVAPGVSHWSSLPQVRNYMQNIAYLARDGYRAGAAGMMNTAWDDSGESLFGDCWHAMAWAAEMAWNPIRSTDPEAARQEMEERERVFNENYQRLTGTDTKTIYAVGDLCGNPWVGDWVNTGALMQPLTEFYPSNTDSRMIERCDSVCAIVGRVLTGMDSAKAPHFHYACMRILATAEKSRLRVSLYRAIEQEEGAREWLALGQRYFQRLHALKLEYLRLWDEECTDYFRDEICSRFDRLGDEVIEAPYQVFVGSQWRGGKVLVTLRNISGAPIYYTLDGRKATPGATQYTAPFAIGGNCLVRAMSRNEWGDAFHTEQPLLCHPGMGRLKRLNTHYSDYQATYSGGGDNALADGKLGSDDNYSDGHWQGYWGEDIDVVYDFGSKRAIGALTLRFLQHTHNWVLAPETIEVYTSKDGKSWTLRRAERFTPDFRETGARVRTDAIRNLNLATRHLRVVVKNPGRLPAWHPAPGQPSYLFCDEIVID